MKKINIFFAAATVLFSISAKPVFEFDGKNTKNLLKLSESGKISKDGVSPVLDGKSALVLNCKLAGEQTILTTVEYKEKPSKIIFSHNRQQDGYRGIELGLCAKYGHDMDGNSPGGTISSGSKDALKSFIFTKCPTLSANKTYTFVLRFTPSKAASLIISDAADKKILLNETINTKEITEISPKAGNGLFVFGARRNSSKNINSFAPNGTTFKKISIWNRVLSDEELGKILGAKVVSVQKSEDKKNNAVSEQAVTAPSKNANPITIYVDNSKGSDSAKGTANSPLKTIQAAAAKVNPGDTVIIAPGVYFENVILSRPGRDDQKITFKAAGKPGSVIITAADKKLRTGKAVWECVDKNLHLYRTPFTHSPCRMLYSGVDLFPYNSLDELKIFAVNHYRVGKATEGSKKGFIHLPAANHGFFFDGNEKMLYVRLHEKGKYGSRNPADHVIAAGAVTAPGGNGHHISAPSHCNLFVDCNQDANIVLDGLNFETPGAAGVITRSGKLIIRNCYFKGCRFGAWSAGVTEGVFIENCYYDQAHAYQDTLEVINQCQNTPIETEFPSYHWTRKRGYKGTNRLVNYETGIAGGAGKYWHIRNCDIVDTFEGLSTWGMSNTVSWRVYGNNMQRHVDNAVEAENHARDLRVHNNLFVDIFEPISYQPLNGIPWPGPVFIYKNVFYNTPEVAPLLRIMGGIHGTFKMGVPGGSWNRAQMNLHKPDNSDLECRFTKRVVFVPYPGFMVFNNTILLKEHALLTLPMPINSRSLANVRFFNNIIENIDLSSRGNKWDGDQFEFYRNAVIKSKHPENIGEKMSEHKGFMLNSAEELKLGKNFAPASASPVLKKGSLGFREPDASTDLGAVPLNGNFQIVTGPGKATDVTKLSPFRQKVFYNPEMLRSAGPVPGEWAVYYIAGEPVYPEKGKNKRPYSFDGYPIPVELSKKANAKSLTVVFRAVDNSGTLLLLDKKSISFSRKGKSVKLILRESGKNKDLAAFKASRDEYVTVKLSKEGIFVNGKKCGSSCDITAKKSQVLIGYNPVFDVIYE